VPSKKDIFCGLDVGTNKIAVVVGQKNESDNPEVIGVGKVENQGMRRGIIVDIEETISAISAALEQAERMAGLSIEQAYVGLGGAHIESSNSKGVIAVSRADGEISDEDMARVIEAARAVSIPTNREIIHVIPRSYIVDGQEGIKDPIGMTGIRLEVEAHVISGSTPAIKNLSRCIYQAGLDIEEYVFPSLASATYLLTKQQKDIGVILIDIGFATTTVAVFEEGDILHSKILPIGGSHITNDIAIGLRTSIETAEKIKIKHGDANPKNFNENNKLDLSKLDPNEDQEISLKYVSEIIEARLLEIFSLVQDELKKIDRQGTMPAGVILTGGGSKLKNITEIAKEILKIPVKVGKPATELTGLVEKLNDPVYSVSTGLMLWGFGTQNSQNLKNPPSKNKINQTTSKIKGWFKHFIP